MEKLTLASLKQGQSAKIIGFNNKLDTKTKRRILELGFVIGQPITLEKLSMRGKVMLFSLRGYLLCMRKNIASLILANIC